MQITDAEFPGRGPFAIPLLARFEGLQLGDNPNLIVAEFRFEDGAKVLVPMSILAAEPLAEMLSTLPAVLQARRDQKKK